MFVKCCLAKVLGLGTPDFISGSPLRILPSFMGCIGMFKQSRGRPGAYKRSYSIQLVKYEHSVIIDNWDSRRLRRTTCPAKKAPLQASFDHSRRGHCLCFCQDTSPDPAIDAPLRSLTTALLELLPSLLENSQVYLSERRRWMKVTRSSTEKSKEIRFSHNLGCTSIHSRHLLSMKSQGPTAKAVNNVKKWSVVMWSFGASPNFLITHGMFQDNLGPLFEHTSSHCGMLMARNRSRSLMSENSQKLRWNLFHFSYTQEREAHASQPLKEAEDFVLKVCLTSSIDLSSIAR